MAVLRGNNLSKKFPGVLALDKVDIEIKSGKVHALVGANGAGKSTLVKILTGYYDSYDGSVTIDNQEVILRTPFDALHNGIEVVHQEVDTQLVPTLTVAENLYLENFANRYGTIVSTRDLKKKAEKDLSDIGFPIPAFEKVENLSLHEKQQLVIARALLHKVKFLILDEPTSSLSLIEAEKLFELVKKLKARDVGILYISQRLDEIQIVADEVTVLRNGRKAAYFEHVPQLSKIVEAMLDSPQEDLFPKKDLRQFGQEILRVEDLKCLNRVNGVSFSVRKGEILAITGLTGAGKTETLKAIFGAIRANNGKIFVNGKQIKITSPVDAIKSGIYLVPEERRKEGLILDKSARENITIPFLKNFCGFLGKILKKNECNHAKSLAEKVRLVPFDIERQAQYFSGGNQQKIVVSRWLGGKPKVLLLDEPTQGVDVGAKKEIYQLIIQVAKESAVILATSEINEAVGIADRILVMRNGKIVTELTYENADSKAIMSYAAGVKQ